MAKVVNMQFSPVSCYFLLMPKSLPRHPIPEYPQPVFFPGCARPSVMQSSWRPSVLQSSCQKVSRKNGMTLSLNVTRNLQYWMWWSFVSQWLQGEDTITQSTWPGGSQKTVGFECEVGRTDGLEPFHSGWHHSDQLECTWRLETAASVLSLPSVYFCLLFDFSNSCASREVRVFPYNVRMLVLQASINITKSPDCVLQI